jgi:8-oxo-dGTP diphosphatase
MCRRHKNPYLGLLNFVGGKIEVGEDSAAAAYRELREETGIGREDIELTHFMDLTYYPYDCRLEVYTGRLNKPVEVSGNENELLWVDAESNFFDMKKFAGEGNIGHIIEHIKLNKDTVLK